MGPPPFVQTTFGEVLAARVAGAAPRGSPFCNAAQADGGFLLCLLAVWGSKAFVAVGAAELVWCTQTNVGARSLHRT